MASIHNCLVVMLLSVPAAAATHCVRAGASGSNSGADWANAWSALPATLVRGDVYYVSAGAYPAYTFDDPVSGSLTTTVKKATAGDHGTETGWSSVYATGQAVFGMFTFRTSHYVIDGQTRNESDWFDRSAYGFSIGRDTEQQQIVIQNYGNAPDDITVKYAYLPGFAAALPSTTQRIYAIDIDDYDGGSISSGLVFHRLFVSESNNVWFLRTTEGAVVEYSASDGVESNSTNHGEIVNLYYSGNNATIRYNRFRNAFKGPGGGGTAIVAITYADGLQFYGNVVSGFSTGDGAVGFAGASSSHNRVSNNTFVDSSGYNAGMAWGAGTDNIVSNNLFINCPTVGIEGTHDFNGFGGSNALGEAHAQTGLTTAIFAGYSTGNFTLQAATAAGATLGAPFDRDLRGALRGADGVFDRGAFEYGSTAAAPAPPTNLRVR